MSFDCANYNCNQWRSQSKNWGGAKNTILSRKTHVKAQEILVDWALTEPNVPKQAISRLCKNLNCILPEVPCK